MSRSPAAAQAETYDLVVVGGGVQGACLALEASSRGLRPLLLERSDYGSGTSANTLRILHGGLRYLQQVDLVRFRESVAARGWWMRRFPDLVEPLACLMPLYDRGLHRRALLQPAIVLNDLLSLGRNRDVRDDLRLAPGRLLARDEVLEAFPGAVQSGLRGGALWYDTSMRSPQRLIIEVLRWAWACGAVSLNYVSATELITQRGGVAGVRAVDRVGGSTLEFRAPLVIDASGPWLGGLLRDSGSSPPAGTFIPSLAFNLLIDRPLAASAAVAVRPSRAGAPVYFLRPHGQMTLAGTIHVPWGPSSGPSAFVEDELVEQFLADLESAAPHLGAAPHHVERILAGLIPAAAPHSARTARRPLIVNHGSAGGPRGYWSVAGVKFTTAPSLARHVLDAARPGVRARDSVPAPPQTRPWISPAQLDELRNKAPHRARATIHDLVEDESVVSLEDLVFRRLDWSLENAAARSGVTLEGIFDTSRLELPAGALADES